MNYYNEHDAKKAAWLRELIKRDVIAPGIVDERSILDIQPDALSGYAQCHFFAGIGVWSYALRQAAVGDDEPCWTGSCPCQPFSAAGQRKGKADERHLWPAWFRLIAVRRPERIFGEQVSSRDGLSWLDDVRSDLEAADYRTGALDLCSAGFGAPHVRQRLYFVAHSGVRGRAESSHGIEPRARDSERHSARNSAPGIVAHGAINGRREELTHGGRLDAGDGAQGRAAGLDAGGIAGIVADTAVIGHSGWRSGEACRELAAVKRPERLRDAGPTNGFWADAEWVWCKDNRYRPVEPGTFPLAHGSAARILRLRGFGDAICAPVATEFIKAAMEVSNHG